MRTRIVITCEHGGNRIPSRYARCFVGARRVVESHRGLDRGALAVARRLSLSLEAPFFFSTVSRLVVDLNRSPSHPSLFSEYTRSLGPEAKRRILDRHYRPYRRQVKEALARTVSSGQAVLHLSVHSFTPRLDGQVRNCDIGILYDPRRVPERAFALRLQRRLAETGFRVRRNYPYRGVADGFTTHLRRALPPVRYRGIEIELNQGTFNDRAALARIGRILAPAIEGAR